MSRLLSSSGYLRGTCLSGFVPFELIIQHFIVVVMCLASLIPGAVVSTPLHCYTSRYFCVEYRIQWRALTVKRGRTVPAWRVPSDLFYVVYVTPTSFPGDNYIIIIYHTCGHKETTFNYTNELVGWFVGRSNRWKKELKLEGEDDKQYRVIFSIVPINQISSFSYKEIKLLSRKFKEKPIYF